MSTKIIVVPLIDTTYQVVKQYINDDDWYNQIEDSEVLYQGSLSDCEAYIRLTEAGYM